MLATAASYVLGAVRGTPPTAVVTPAAVVLPAVPQSYEISPYRCALCGHGCLCYFRRLRPELIVLEQRSSKNDRAALPIPEPTKLQS